jgi:hypothetical protein
VQFDPNSADALNNLAWALATSPRPELRNGPRAVTLAHRACELTQFKKTMFLGTLAAAQAATGKFDDAIAAAQKACALAVKTGKLIYCSGIRNCWNATASMGRRRKNNGKEEL